MAIVICKWNGHSQTLCWWYNTKSGGSVAQSVFGSYFRSGSLCDIMLLQNIEHHRIYLVNYASL